jgi:hypothetical protein
MIARNETVDGLEASGMSCIDMMDSQTKIRVLLSFTRWNIHYKDDETCIFRERLRKRETHGKRDEN